MTALILLLHLVGGLVGELGEKFGAAIAPPPLSSGVLTVELAASPDGRAVLVRG